MMIVFDLDGTLADDGHREHFLTGHGLKSWDGKKDWDSYFAACYDDIPIDEVIAVMRDMAFAWDENKSNFRWEIEVWTGRSEAVREETMRWLNDFVTHDWWYKSRKIQALRMRPVGDHRPACELKRQWLQEKMEKGEYVFLAFDDRDEDVEMWRSEGVTCFQVEEFWHYERGRSRKTKERVQEAPDDGT